MILKAGQPYKEQALNAAVKSGSELIEVPMAATSLPLKVPLSLVLVPALPWSAGYWKRGQPLPPVTRTTPASSGPG